MLSEAFAGIKEMEKRSQIQFADLHRKYGETFPYTNTSTKLFDEEVASSFYVNDRYSNFFIDRPEVWVE